ncbi:putative transcription factor [Capsicum chacoense]|uniref:probable transcription factor At4g00390 n=1 Tax=Capsicum annuum TaxID=4072 RepID=UPI001FB158C9|nr:probable transcription factor At4g00390 [Capsicum annuum]KAF3644583.1 hypothetical protein FXO38_20096 [Capsicum annuum]
MAARNIFKSLKAKRPHGDSDKEWTPSPEDSQTYSPEEVIMESSNVNKSGFQRAWSEEEEIAILQGHLNYSFLKNSEPSSNYGAFLTFVKDDLQTETNKTQLQHKLTRLKRKYKRNIEKRKFSKSHDEKLFKLSEKIWGEVDKVRNKVDKTSGKMIVDASRSEMSWDFVLNGGTSADLEDWFRRNPRQLISEKERNEMLEKSQSVKVAKARQYLLEIQVMEEQAKMATDAIQAILS